MAIDICIYDIKIDGDNKKYWIGLGIIKLIQKIFSRKIFKEKK
jgi:hypothetical protein